MGREQTALHVTDVKYTRFVLFVRSPYTWWYTKHTHQLSFAICGFVDTVFLPFPVKPMAAPLLHPSFLYLGHAEFAANGIVQFLALLAKFGAEEAIDEDVGRGVHGQQDVAEADSDL